MENVVKIGKNELYFVISKKLKRVFVIEFIEKNLNHLYAEQFTYKKFPSKTYWAYYLQQRKKTLKTIDLDNEPDNKCFLIAEDLEEKADIMCISKVKKDLVYDFAFEEPLTIPENLNI